MNEKLQSSETRNRVNGTCQGILGRKRVWLSARQHLPKELNQATRRMFSTRHRID